MNQDVAVTVWQDQTEADRPWIVDRIDEDGNSNTAAVFTEYTQAVEFARQHATARGLEFTETD